MLETTPAHMASNEPRVHPQHALAVYAESLAVGGRVAVFGDASVGLGTRLCELGARSVSVWDPDPVRALAAADDAPAACDVRPYGEGDERAFDLAIVADLGLFEDPAALVARVRRLVGNEGVAVFSAKSADVAREETSRAFDYYELFDLVAPEFEGVRMVAQLPFFGVALVELGDNAEGDESPGVSVDTQLGDTGRAPDSFVVVASQREARLEPYAIVQLPAPRGRADLGDDERESTDRRVARDALSALTQAELRGELLSTQIEELRAHVGGAERAADTIMALEEALRARSTHVVELERALCERGRELAELSNEVEEMRATSEAGRIAAVQVEEVARRADRAERRLAVLEHELTQGGEAQSREPAQLEAALRERAQSARQLEAELARRDQMVRDLLGTLEEAGGGSDPDGATEAEPLVDAVVVALAPAASPAPAVSAAAPIELAHVRLALETEAAAEVALAEENARLRAQLDLLALELARREGAAQATVWQVAELERQVEQLESQARARPVGPDPSETLSSAASSRELAQALDELDALRRALAQEHEARKHAESGTELARARAEIERQAVLLEQLGQELRTLEGQAPAAERPTDS